MSRCLKGTTAKLYAFTSDIPCPTGQKKPPRGVVHIIQLNRSKVLPGVSAFGASAFSDSRIASCSVLLIDR